MLRLSRHGLKKMFVHKFENLKTRKGKANYFILKYEFGTLISGFSNKKTSTKGNKTTYTY